MAAEEEEVDMVAAVVMEVEEDTAVAGAEVEEATITVTTGVTDELDHTNAFTYTLRVYVYPSMAPFSWLHGFIMSVQTFGIKMSTA